MRIAGMAALMLAATLSGAAQVETPGVFSSSSDLVVLHATVTDRRGRYAAGLTRDAFSVAEDGAPQTVRFFVEQDSPVSMGVLIDASGSMYAIRDRVAAAVSAFVEASHPDDEFFSLLFNDVVTPVLPSATPFTNDPLLLGEAIGRRLGGYGRTALYDAVVRGTEHVARGAHARKVLVLLSDGGDNASAASLEEVQRRTQASNAVIYTVALADPLARGGNPGLLRRLADTTGGLAFRPRDSGDVADALRAINRDIRSSYTLGYESANLSRDGGFRRVHVAARGAGGQRLTVRHRAGYLAAADRERVGA